MEANQTERPEQRLDVVYQRAVQSLRNRRWPPLAESWLDHIPVFSPGHPPGKNLAEHYELESVFPERPAKNELTEVNIPRSGIPEVILGEAIMWLYKSTHVFGAMEVHIKQGLATWAVSEAYQAAYYSARSILAFFGVALCENHKVTVISDICIDMNGATDRQIARRGGAFSPQASLRSCGILLGHIQTWNLLKRLMQVGTCNLWEPEWRSHIANFDFHDVTNPRHLLHYSCHHWMFEDLIDYKFPSALGELCARDARGRYCSPSENHFTFHVSGLMLQMALRIFGDMCRKTDRLSAHMTTMERILAERNPLFGTDFLGALRFRIA